MLSAIHFKRLTIITSLFVTMATITACSDQKGAPVHFSELIDFTYFSTKSNEQEPQKISDEKPPIPASIKNKQNIVHQKDQNIPVPASIKNKTKSSKTSDKIADKIKNKDIETKTTTTKTSTSAPPKQSLPVVKTKPKKKIYNAALLLPLTGETKNVGQNLLNAAELALFDFNSPNIAIKPYDTKGTESGAKNAINKAIDDDIDIVIGPLFSKTTKAIANIAKENNITVLSLSNDSSLAKEGVLVFGYTPEDQIKETINFAIENNVFRFSALLPKNKYGKLLEKVIIEELDKEDILPQQIQWYDSVDEQLSHSIKRIARFPEIITEDYLRHKSELLIIPESGPILTPIISRLSSKNLDTKRFRFAGTSQWEQESISSNKKLIGSWFAATNLNDIKNFKNVFKNNFGYVPENIASLAYDALALTLLITQDNPPHITKDNFNPENTYEGISGIFSFTNDGVIKRKLNIYEIEETQIKKLN